MGRPRIKKQGFASFSRKKLKEVSSKGGKNSQSSGFAYRFTPETSRKAVEAKRLKRLKLQEAHVQEES